MNAQGEPGEAEGGGRTAAGKDDILVFITRHDGACAECGEAFANGAFIRVEEGRTLCLGCADLDHLVYLPRGDTALTRRASKYSPLRALVLLWSRSRKRYERQGILVAGDAIERAQAENAGDSDQRAHERKRAAERRAIEDAAYVREVAQAIAQQFPGCPPAEAQQIADWTCRKHSGRVGRSAAAKELAPEALRLAVVAHIRHTHTNYDQRLMRGEPRLAARDALRSQISQMLEQWRAPRPIG